MNTMPCGECGAPMKWTGMTAGWMCPVCGKSRTAQTPTGEIRSAVENVVSSETILGPSGAPVWVVTIHAERPNVEDYTEVRHVRAMTQDGAILVAAEQMLDFTYMNAEQVTE